LEIFKKNINDFQVQGLDSLKKTKAIEYIIAALEELKKGMKGASTEEYNGSVTWTSQFDASKFGQCTGCWQSSCCRRAAEYMMGNANIANCSDTIIAQKAPYMAIVGKITTANFSNNTKTYTQTEYNAAILNADSVAMKDAIMYMKTKLQSNRPILIGVHYTSAVGQVNNTNRATHHWMVIKSYKKEQNGQEYFLFYDPGRSVAQEDEATSDDNKLIVNRQLSKIQGIYRRKTYTITEIIKTN
jgi:hypothetical protein